MSGLEHVSKAQRICYSDTTDVSVEIGQMSAVETGQMSCVETEQMFAAETEQMSAVETGPIYSATYIYVFC